MFALKSSAAVLLAAMVLTVITPPLAHQDAGPGKPDDVAQLLPQDTIAFVELVKAPKLLNDWKEYVGSVMAADGKDKVCAFIEDFFKQTLEIVPEKLLKDFKEGLPTLQRMAFALTAMPFEDFPWIFIATSSDPGFFKKIIDDLAVFASEEKAHGGVKVLAIRKMGDLRWEAPLFVAAMDHRLVLTTSWPNATDAIDRAAGKGTGGDLRKNPLYARLAPAPSDDPSIRAFSKWDFDALASGPRRGPFSNRRYSSLEMDQVDSVFGFRQIGGAVVEATFKPGRVVSTLRMPVTPPCRLFEAARQPAGPKDLLAHLPKKTIGFVHQNLKGGKEVWADVEDFIRRYEQSERKTRPGRDPQDYIEEMNEETKREIGILPKEIAEIVGNELLLIGCEPGEAAGPESMFTLLFKTTDPAKARELMDTVAKTSGKITTETQDKTTIYTHEGRESICFGLRESVVGIAANAELLKEALNSKEDASGVAKKLPKEIESVATVGAVNTARLIDVIFHFVGGEKPEPLTHMKPDDWVVATARLEKDQAVVTVIDSGYGAILQTGMATFPMLAFGMFYVFRMEAAVATMPDAVAPGKPEPEPAALAAEELAKRVSENVPQLRSEELAVRDRALTNLKALGRQAVPKLVEAFKAEKDVEARTRLSRLLLEYNAWDALPELLDAKVGAFFDEFRAAFDGKEDEGGWNGYAIWSTPDAPEPWSMEPYQQEYFLKQFKNADLVSIPQGLKKLAERVRKAELAAGTRLQFAGLFAFNPCAEAHEVVLEMRDAATDAPSRAFLTIALGWSAEAKAKEAVYRSLESKDLAVRRGAFIAAERMSDPEIVTRLLDRTKDSEFETRWNAGHTLRVLTNGAVKLNAFLPEAEYDAQIQAARKWWDANKGSFKIPKK
jgi:hypothetical protein